MPANTPATPTPVVRLTDRGIVSVSGPDAAAFLHTLVSANIERLTPGDATYAALLTPQGKVLFDFFVVRDGDALLIDVALDQAAALAKRLGFYKLRSQIVIVDRSGDLSVAAGPDAAAFPEGAIAYIDPRVAGLGARAILSQSLAADLPPAGIDYDRRRIAAAIPESGIDFKSADVVPHDVNFDDLGAIDFRKGCYIGQEIVSRMKHRNTARRRLVHVSPADGVSPLPAPGTEIFAGPRAIGSMGSSIDGHGLAIVRLDWVKDAEIKGISVTAGDVALTITLPAYATFRFPETVSET